MFLTALEELFSAHRSRLQETYGLSATQAAFAKLDAANLSPEDIDKSCARELVRVLTKRYDEPIASSRLEGYGWSTGHVKDHMQRYLKDLMNRASSLIRLHFQEGPYEDTAALAALGSTLPELE